MSRGNKILKVRVEPELLSAIEIQIQQRNIYTKNQPWNMSDFIRAAMLEKLKKMERSRACRERV